MITRHYQCLHLNIDWHTVIDDFGNELEPFRAMTDHTSRAWANAYRFANGQTFAQAECRSVNCVVAEH